MMRWIGLNDGYVSGDGRFLVAQVTVQGRKGTTQKWVLYGLVRLETGGLSCTWRWTEQPIHGPCDTKRACQEWAAASGYESTTEHVHAMLPTARAAGEAGVEKPMGWEICQECGVRFTRKAGHLYEDYCGGNCFTIVCERVAEIQTAIRARRTRPQEAVAHGE